MMSLAARPKKAKITYDTAPKRDLPIAQWLGWIAVFALAFGLRYWFNFVSQHINNYGSCDASEYLRNAGALLNLHASPASFWSDAWSCLSATASAETVGSVKHVLSPLSDLAIAGPTFPLFIAACYAVGGVPFSIAAWAPPVMGNCVVSALTCVFMGLAASHAFSRRAGWLTAILCAVYPAFILNSGRLYSETFAAFLISVVCFITTRGFAKSSSIGETFALSLINGFVAACLQFTRSIMLVLTVVLAGITLMQQGFKKGTVGLVAFVIGFGIAAAPWLCFQHLAFGKSSLLLDRVGHYNFFTGNDVNTQGWLSFPYQDYTGVDATPMPELAKQAYQKSPSRWLRLMQDKPLRLYKFPWNDFRQPIGELTFFQQVLIHQVLLILAAIGLVLGFCRRRPQRELSYEPTQEQRGGTNAAKAFLLFTFLLHSAYLFFITVPRYNLTSMPILIAFSAAGIVALVDLCRVRNGRSATLGVVATGIALFAVPRLSEMTTLARAAGGTNGMWLQSALNLSVAVVFAFALAFAIRCFSHEELAGHKRAPGKRSSKVALAAVCVLCLICVVLPVAANGRADEWKVLVAPNATISQRFELPRSFDNDVQARQLYLIFDSTGQDISHFNIAVNGKRIDAPALPGISMVDDFSRFQSLPTGGFMREGEWVFDCLTQSAGIHNSDLRQWFVIPIPNSAVVGKAEAVVALRNTDSEPHTVYGASTLSHKLITVPSITSYSWEKAFYGVENDKGFTDTRFDFKVDGDATAEQAKAKGAEHGRLYLHLLAGPPVAQNTTVYTVEREMPANPAITVLRTAHSGQSITVWDSNSSRVLRVTELPAFGKDDWWVVRIKGAAKRTAGSAKVSLKLKGLLEGGEAPYVSPWTSDLKLTDAQEQRIDASVPIKPGSFKKPLQQIECSLQIVEPTGSGATQLNNVAIEISKLPNNPLGPSFKTY